MIYQNKGLDFSQIFRFFNVIHCYSLLWFDDNLVEVILSNGYKCPAGLVSRGNFAKQGLEIRKKSILYSIFLIQGWQHQKVTKYIRYKDK